MAESSQLGLVHPKDKSGENEYNPLNLGVERSNISGERRGGATLGVNSCGEKVIELDFL